LFTISSKLSGTYNAALQAQKLLSAEMKNRVHVFDTLNGSASQGLMALEAIKQIKQGFRTQEIVNKLNEEIKNFKLMGAYREGKWLEASGRIPHFIQRGVEKMKLQPLFGLKEGKIAIISIKKNVKELSETIFQEFEKILER